MLYGFFNPKQFLCTYKTLLFRDRSERYPFCIYLTKTTGEYAIVTQVNEGEKYSANWDGPTHNYGPVGSYISTAVGLNMGVEVNHDALRKALQVIRNIDKTGEVMSIMHSCIPRLVPNFKFNKKVNHVSE